HDSWTLHTFPTRRSSDLVRGVVAWTEALVRYAGQPMVLENSQASVELTLGSGEDGLQFPLREGTPHEKDGVDLASEAVEAKGPQDRKSTRLNSSHVAISY